MRRSKIPKRITPRMLRLTIACQEQQELFLEVFPDGMEVTRANLVAAAAAGLSIDWGAEEFLTAPALKKYMAATIEPDQAYLLARTAAHEASAEAKEAGEDLNTASQRWRTACNEAYKAHNITVAQILADVLSLP